MVAGSAAERPDAQMEAREFKEVLSEKLHEFAKTLKGREETIFRERWLTETPLTLQELGDRYAVYGFSGQGRSHVEFYLVKPFQEGLTARVRGRIGGIEPRRSTRMGTALRHARMKMTNVTARSKHVFLLSDGFPQDFDYGADRRSNTYGIQDTMMALKECQAAGITPFCITIDRESEAELRDLYGEIGYTIIDDVLSLPERLPGIYRRLTT